MSGTLLVMNKSATVTARNGLKSCTPQPTDTASWTRPAYSKSVLNIVSLINKLNGEESRPMYWSVYLLCDKCGFNWGELIKKELRGHPIDCVSCGAIGSAKEKVSAPNVMGVATKNGQDSGAYPDGIRAKKDSYKKMKEAAKLEVQAANMPYEKRTEIKKEIRKLKEVK